MTLLKARLKLGQLKASNELATSSAAGSFHMLWDETIDICIANTDDCTILVT
jgi:hypothetical protein